MSNTMNAMDDAGRASRSSAHGATCADGAGRPPFGSAKEMNMRSFTNALAMIVSGVDAAAGVVRTLHRLDRDDALGWLGMSRRRSPLLTLVLLGAGAAVGAGIALLFAPMAGAELRSVLTRRPMADAEKVETGADGVGDEPAHPGGGDHAPGNNGRSAIA